MLPRFFCWRCTGFNSAAERPDRSAAATTWVYPYVVQVEMCSFLYRYAVSWLLASALGILEQELDAQSRRDHRIDLRRTRIEMTTAGVQPARGDLMRNRAIRFMLLAVAMVFFSGASFAQLRVSVRIAPPMLEVYDQPISPGDGYIWTPGYWAYGDDDYYWVAGDWVMAPEPGFLWTPGYWGWGDDGYFFNEGYWGNEVGFYGGINYGFGYYGHGFEGGRWDHGRYFNNSSVNHLNGATTHDSYEARVNEGSPNRTSFNGGTGGVNARATSQEESAARGRHIAPVAAQTQHMQAAHNDPQARLSTRSGATSGGAGGNSAAAHTETTARPEAGARPEVAAKPNAIVHPKDLPAVSRPDKPNTGNAKTDQKYQKEQDKLVANQTKERNNLQQKQDQEHSQLTKQNANAARSQQVEQQHEQQTRQLQQTHTQQTQQMQQRQAPPANHGGGRGGRGES
jgi:hypothetical protein